MARSPVSAIPVEGFTTDSEYSSEQNGFEDETVRERIEWELKNGRSARQCGQEHPTGGRGVCTRVKGHVLRGESGMHLAGTGEYLVGAW